MSIGLLIITHGKIGEALLDTAVAVLGFCPLKVKVLSVPMGCEPESFKSLARQQLTSLKQDEGVLVLTDLYGSTPYHIANSLLGDGVNVVSGINLPMLIRTLNYANVSLDVITQKALSGGKDGVLFCQKVTQDDPQTD